MASAAGSSSSLKTRAIGTTKGQYVLQRSFRFRDNYDWEFNDMGAGPLKDREMALLNLNGFARDYEMVGEQKMTLRWVKGQRYESGASYRRVPHKAR